MLHIGASLHDTEMSWTWKIPRHDKKTKSRDTDLNFWAFSLQILVGGLIIVIIFIFFSTNFFYKFFRFVIKWNVKYFSRNSYFILLWWCLNFVFGHNDLAHLGHFFCYRVEKLKLGWESIFMISFNIVMKHLW